MTIIVQEVRVATENQVRAAFKLLKALSKMMKRVISPSRLKLIMSPCLQFIHSKVDDSLTLKERTALKALHATKDKMIR